MAKGWKKKRRQQGKVVQQTTAQAVPLTTDTHDELTDAEIHFCTEYAYTRNGVQSFMKAFGEYTGVNGERRKRSYKAAAGEAIRLLEKPRIQEEIAHVRQSSLRKSNCSAARVLKELVSIALSDPAECWGMTQEGTPTLLYPPDMPIETRRAISTQEIKRSRRIVGRGEAKQEWEVEDIKYKFWPKTDALAKLCQRLGITGPDSSPHDAEPSVIELPSNNRNADANDQATEGAAK